MSIWPFGKKQSAEETARRQQEKSDLQDPVAALKRLIAARDDAYAGVIIDKVSGYDNVRAVSLLLVESGRPDLLKRFFKHRGFGSFSGSHQEDATHGLELFKAAYRLKDTAARAILDSENAAVEGSRVDIDDLMTAALTEGDVGAATDIFGRYQKKSKALTRILKKAPYPAASSAWIIDCCDAERYDDTDMLTKTLGVYTAAGDAAMTARLILRGADMTARNGYAFFAACEKGHADVAAIMIKNGFVAENYPDQLRVLLASLPRDSAVRHVLAQVAPIFIEAPREARPPVQDNPDDDGYFFPKKDVIGEEMSLPGGKKVTTLFNFKNRQQTIITENNGQTVSETKSFDDLSITTLREVYNVLARHNGDDNPAPYDDGRPTLNFIRNEIKK